MALKRAVWDKFLLFCYALLILRIRRVYVPDASARRQRPWRWRSFASRVRSRWRRLGSHSRGRPSARRGFPRKWVLEFEKIQNFENFCCTGDSLHTTTARKAADCWLGNALDVVTQDLSMAFGAPFSESLSSLASSGHFSLESVGCVESDGNLAELC